MILSLLLSSPLLAQEPAPQEPPALEPPPAEQQEPVVEVVEPPLPPDDAPRRLPPWRKPVAGPEPQPESFLDQVQFGLTLDLFGAFTEKHDSVDEFNEVRIRSAQFHFAAPVEGVGRAHVTFDYSDPGDGSDFFLREAYVRVDELPIGFWPESMDFFVGQYFADLGAFNGVLPNEFPAPSLSGAQRTFLGGNLAARGVELHQRLDDGAFRFRWSAGLASELESHDPDASGNGIAPTDPELAEFGRFGFQNWSGTGRVEGQMDFDCGVMARVGASGLWTPRDVRFSVQPGTGTVRDEARHLLWGLDGGVRWEVPHSEMAHEVSLELWVDDNEYRTAFPGPLVGETERGETLLYEFTLNRRWSAGALFSRFDQPSPGLDVDGHFHEGWITYAFSHASRFSLFMTHTNPAPGEEKWYTVGGEWVFDLGTRREQPHRRWM